MPANAPPPTLLWPDGAPGAQGDTDADKPAIYAWLPASNPTKSAVVIAPGGGYEHLSVVREGSDVAAWLNAHGIAAIQLRYRLGPKYHNPIELGDVSIPTENSSFCWLKIPPPTWWLRFTVAADSMKMESAGEAEAGSAGVQPAKE
jgi:hypothetical protein